MNRLTGHLRPEPYRGLLPSLSRLRQSSAGQGGWRQFPFFSLLSVLSEPKGHMAWGNGGGGSKFDGVKKSKSQANDSKEGRKHGPANTAKTFLNRVIY